MPRQASDDAQWQTVIADFRRSGLNQPEFCLRRGLPLHTFRRRLYARPAVPPPPTVIPVTLVPGPSSPSPAAAASDPLVLILDGGLRIAVAPGFDPATLARLLDALETRP
jgi:hypothetical protein